MHNAEIPFKPSDDDVPDHEYKVGDNVWIFAPNHQGQKSHGVIVHQFEIGGAIKFVIALKTGIDDVYEVRDPDTMSPDANGPIGMFRRLWRVFA